MDIRNAPRLGPRFVAAVDYAVDLHDGQVESISGRGRAPLGGVALRRDASAAGIHRIVRPA